MKFTVSSQLSKNRFFCFLLAFFCIQILLFSIFNPYYEQTKWGLSASEIALKILGDEESFIPALTLKDLIAQIHIELFIYPFILIMNFLIFFHLKFDSFLKVTLMGVSFFFCLVNSLSPLLVFAIGPSLAVFKVVSFWGLMILIIFTTLADLSYLIRSLRSAQ